MFTTPESKGRDVQDLADVQAAIVKGMGLKLYDVAGQNIFPLYGSNGGVTTRVCSYLLRMRTGAPQWNVDGGDLGRMVGSRTEAVCLSYHLGEIQAAESLRQLVVSKIAEAWNDFEPVNLDGGAMPARRIR